MKKILPLPQKAPTTLRRMKPWEEEQEKRQKEREKLYRILEEYAAHSPLPLSRFQVFLWAVSELGKDLASTPIRFSEEYRSKIREIEREREILSAEVSKLWKDRLDSLFSALKAGNDGPFFNALKEIGGGFIFEPRISEMIQAKLLSAVVDNKDRAFLVKLKKKICFVGSGQMPQLNLEAQDEARSYTRSKSAAVTRLMKKYDKWINPPFNMTSEESRRQAEQEFRETTKLTPELQKEVVIEFRKKIATDRDREK